MAIPTDLVESLKVIATLVTEMDECAELCAHVHRRLVVISDKLLATEKQKTLSPDVGTRNYSALVTDYQAFLTEHRDRLWTKHLVSSSCMIGKVRSFQERTSALMLTLYLIHQGDVAEERAAMERFRTEQERVAAALQKRRKADAIVTPDANPVIKSAPEQTDSAPAGAATTTAISERDVTTPGSIESAELHASMSTAPAPMTLEEAIAQDDVASTTLVLTTAASINEPVDVWDVPPLIVAAALGAAKVTAMLLDRGTNPGALWQANVFKLPQFNGADVTALHVAAQAGHASVVETLLTAKTDLVTNLTTTQHSALRDTAQFGHMDATEEPQRHVAWIDELDSYDQTPLFWSAVYGQVQSARVLLEHDADVYAKRLIDGATALHQAARDGHIGVIDVLLNHGAHIDEPDSDGMTPLIYAAHYGQFECSRFLLERGADVHAKSSSNGCTALHQASAAGCADTIKALLFHGARIDELDANEQTPLYWSALHGKTECARVLFTYKANVHAKTRKYGATVLHEAAASGHSDMINVLLRRGAHTDEPDADGITPLMYAAKFGEIECARVLLEHGADVHAKSNGNGKTALHNACASEHADMFNELLHHGARIDEPDSVGQTPLRWCASGDQIACAHVLLDHNADIHAKTHKNGTTALHGAVGKGNVDLIEELLRRGANIDEPDNNGCTPLYWSANINQLESARVLLEHKADIHVKTIHNSRQCFMKRSRKGALR